MGNNKNMEKVNHVELTNIEELSEVDLWREIDKVEGILIVGACNRVYYGLDDGKYEQLFAYYYQLAYQTRKFGVVFDHELEDEKFGLSESFKYWREYWLSTLMSFGHDIYLGFQQGKINGKDLKDLPAVGTWLEEYKSMKRKLKS